MLLKTGLRQKLTAQISRLAPTRTPAPGAHEHDTPLDLYKSIEIGNALAEIEDNASRKWRGQ